MTVYQLPATVTLTEVGGLLAALKDAPEVVDASALTAFDSSTIAFLMEAKRRAQAAGKGFEVRGLPEKLQALAALYGVDGLLSSGTT